MVAQGQAGTHKHDINPTRQTETHVSIVASETGGMVSLAQAGAA